MKRLNLVIDLDDNEIFTKEVHNAIQAQIKTITREMFDREIKAQIEQIVESRLAKWLQKHPYEKFNMYESYVRHLVDCNVESALKTEVLRMIEENQPKLIETINVSRIIQDMTIGELLQNSFKQKRCE